jgi:predicted transposase/invertase (TIGR01784 family)
MNENMLKCYKRLKIYERARMSIMDKADMLSTAIEEAKQERNLEIAKNMLAKGIDLETISSVTGLSIEKIKN